MRSYEFGFDSALRGCGVSWSDSYGKSHEISIKAIKVKHPTPLVYSLAANAILDLGAAPDMVQLSRRAALAINRDAPRKFPLEDLVWSSWNIYVEPISFYSRLSATAGAWHKAESTTAKLDTDLPNYVAWIVNPCKFTKYASHVRRHIDEIFCPVLWGGDQTYAEPSWRLDAIVQEYVEHSIATK
jgi:hypothetical protein